MDIVRQLVSRIRWRLFAVWAALLVMVWIFTELADEVYEDAGFFFDEPILTWFNSIIDPNLTRLAQGLSIFGDVPAMLALSLFVTLLLLAYSRREAIFFASSMAGASLIMLITKYLFARPRPELFPDVELWEASSPSFPSGHATGSMTLFFSLFLVVRHFGLWRWQYVAALLGGLIVLGVSMSRLYLQVHYPSDILAGLALGLGWVLASNMVYRARVDEQSHRIVVLRLPKNLVEIYQQKAKEQQQDEDAFISDILERHFDSRNSP